MRRDVLASSAQRHDDSPPREENSIQTYDKATRDREDPGCPKNARAAGRRNITRLPTRATTPRPGPYRSLQEPTRQGPPAELTRRGNGPRAPVEPASISTEERPSLLWPQCHYGGKSGRQRPAPLGQAVGASFLVIAPQARALLQPPRRRRPFSAKRVGGKISAMRMRALVREDKLRGVPWTVGNAFNVT